MSSEPPAGGLPPQEQSDDEYKLCPDCAERVRAAARKCRFCGYRFDSGAGQPGAAAAETLRDGAGHEREPARGAGAPSQSGEQTRSVLDLVEEWGVAVHPDEQVAFFLPARAKPLDDTPAPQTLGYLLVTDRRLLILAPPRRGLLALLRRDSTTAKAEIAFERTLAQTGEVAVHQRWGKAQLRLGDDIVLSDIPPARVEEIRSHIEART